MRASRFKALFIHIHSLPWAKTTKQQQPMFRYLRYNVDLESQALTDLLRIEVTDVEAKQLETIERVELASRYAEIGRAVAEKCISSTHFK